jgi:hypothetical protein
MTIDQMERRALDDGLHMEAMDQITVEETKGGVIVRGPGPIRLLPGCGLSHGLASVMRQAEQAHTGIFWALVAIASWVTCGGSDRSPSDGFDDDGFDHNTYASLLAKWPSMTSHMQTFEVRRHGKRGAELAVNGGASMTEDDSLTTYPIQRWLYADFPWSADNKPFRVWAMREVVDGRPAWVLMLPSEY